jgi:translocation and assembly module TamB
MRLRRWLWLLLLLLPVVAGVVLVSTEAGLHGAVAIVKRVLPGKLSYGHLSGRLIGPLQVENLRYRQGELDIDLKQAELDWYPSQLLTGRLQIGLIKIAGLELHLPPAAPAPKTPAEPFKLSAVPLPLQVDIAALSGTDIQLWPSGKQQPVRINAVTLQGTTRERTVQLQTLEVQAPEGDLQLAGQLELAGDNPLELRLHGTWQNAQYGPLTAQGQLEGELGKTLAVSFKLAGTVTAELEGTLTHLLTDPGWSARLALSVVTLGRFVPALTDSPLTGELKTQGSLQAFQLSGGLTTVLPELGKVEAGLQVSGNPQTVSISELKLRAVDRPLALTTRATFDLNRQMLDASGQWQALVWPLTGAPQVESPRGQFKLQGTLQRYSLDLQAELAGPDLGHLNARLQASGTDRTMTVSALSLRAPATPLAFNGRGELNFAEQAFQAEGDWQALSWPLTGTPRIDSPHGNFKASGTPKDYRFTLTTQLQGPAVPKGEWTLAGQGNDQALPKLTLDGKLLEGEIHGTLSTAWQPAVNWQAELSGTRLNPAAHWPDFPGRLAFRLRSQGGLADKSLQTTVELSELAGTLRGQAVQGKAQLAVKGQEFLIPTLQLTMGRTRLNATGSLAQRWDVRWQLEAPELGQLLPGGSGAVSSSGSLSGLRAQPRLALELAVTRLTYGETALQHLQGKVDVDLSGGSRSQLQFTGEGLHLAGQTWNNLNLAGAGTSVEHTLQGSLTGHPGHFEWALTGSFNQSQGTWQGRLNRLTAQDTVVGNWSLDRPLPVQVSARQAQVQPACLVSKSSRLCVQGSWDTRTGASGRFSLERLELERFAFLLPPNLKLDASLNGEASGARRPDGSLQGKLNLQLSPGRLSFRQNHSPLEIAVEGGGLQAESNGKDATARLNLGLGRTGQLQANVQAGNLTGVPRLNGKVTAEFRDLGLVSAFVPQLQKVSGQLVADLNLSGTSTAPVLGGALRLTGAAADIPPVAVHLQDVQLAAVSEGNGTLQLSGSARSGSGTLRLTGTARPTPGQLEMTVKGENFQVANTAEIQALLSPDLTLMATREQVRVEGQVVIPKARLNVKGGGEANRVSTSPDVIIVSQTKGSEPPARVGGLAVYARVRVILGDDVRVGAFDFRGHIKGNVLVEETPELAPYGTGSVEVKAGEYIMSGQGLQIEHGRLLFTNSPLDNPGLDLRVTRTVENFTAPTPDQRQVTVGAQVSGTLQNPKLNLFSNPAMPDSSIFSYLVLGQAPETAKQSSLLLGRYLSPDLYIGYGVGLYNAINTFVLRYRLSKRLNVEATSNSLQTGADLFYTIEQP